MTDLSAVFQITNFFFHNSPIPYVPSLITSFHFVSWMNGVPFVCMCVSPPFLNINWIHEWQLDAIRSRTTNFVILIQENVFSPIVTHLFEAISFLLTAASLAVGRARLAFLESHTIRNNFEFFVSFALLFCLFRLFHRQIECVVQPWWTNRVSRHSLLFARRTLVRRTFRAVYKNHHRVGCRWHKTRSICINLTTLDCRAAAVERRRELKQWERRPQNKDSLLRARARARDATFLNYSVGRRRDCILQWKMFTLSLNRHT